MANLSILDTGYLKTDNSGTQLAATSRANSGNLINLKTVNFKPTAKSNLDTNPVLGTFAEAEIHLVSFENLGFSIQGRVDTRVSADLDLIWQLVLLCRTKGYKAMFYNVDKDATDTGANQTLERDKQLVTNLANEHYDTTEPQTGISFSLWTGAASTASKNLTNVEHMMVRFIDVTFTQSPKSKLISYSLKGISTK